MTPGRRLKRLFRWTRNSRLLVLFFCSILLAMGLVGNPLLDEAGSAEFFGISIGFAVKFLAAPIAAIFVLAQFLQLAEDNDRYDAELENE